MQTGIAFILALLIFVVFYTAAVASRRNKAGAFKWDPTEITQGVYGKASLANLQLFFFTLIVVFAVAYQYLSTLELSAFNLSTDVLALLGVHAAGTAGAKIVATTKKNVSTENEAWLKGHKWITNHIGPGTRTPQWSDLFYSDERFDVSKFQMLVFSFLVGIALLVQGLNEGGLEKFTIAGAVIGLIGGSQTLYVGGKAVAPAEITELNSRLNILRKKEIAFVNAALDGWAAQPRNPNDTLLDAAKNAAPKEYNEYLVVAEEAILMLQDQTGLAVPAGVIGPKPPRV